MHAHALYFQILIAGKLMQTRVMKVNITCVGYYSVRGNIPRTVNVHYI